FDIIYGKGISREGEIIDFATKLGIMEKSGVWYSYKGEKIGQGREKAKEFLEQNPQIREEIERAIREKLGLAGETSQSEEAASEESNSGPNE
ncbi:DNA recombination/repair protein RecA, partial [bacterium]|nr:DNA recombination/repair protein RecA [bacterium]